MRRSGDKGQRKATRARTEQSRIAQRTIKHPMFGAIPLVTTSWTDGAGRERSGAAYDASYRPALPEGAVRGDITRQHFCPMCHVPRYFYVDSERTCSQCGEGFVFSGAEQKFWYETLKFHFDSVATRCPACRRKRRSDKALQQQLAQASAEAAADQDNPTKQVALAEAIVRLFERLSMGSLPRAIAACRKARRVCGTHPSSELSEALFWEAKAHALAGRVVVARKLFGHMLALGSVGKRKAQLLEEARSWLLVR
jgi:hypothetical protein